MFFWGAVLRQVDRVASEIAHMWTWSRYICRSTSSGFRSKIAAFHCKDMHQMSGADLELFMTSGVCETGS